MTNNYNPFKDMDVLFQLDAARNDLTNSKENRNWSNRTFGWDSDESRKWREIVQKDSHRVDVLSMIVEKKKAYLFG